MEKKLSDEELDRLLEEQFLKEADLIEKALFSDDLEDCEEETEEEVEEAYNDLVARLKASGKYRGDDEECSVEPENSAEEPVGKVISMPDKNANNEREVVPYSRRSHKFARVAGFAAVCVLGVFAASMTSEANRKYFINTMKYLSGDDTRLIIGNDETNEDVNENEYKAREDIESTLGIKIPEFLYRPNCLNFRSYEVNELGNFAIMEYDYRDSIVALYCLKKDDVGGSVNFSLHGEKIATAELHQGKLFIDVFEVKENGDIQPSYTAQWEQGDVAYRLSGRMEKEEFLKIVEKIKF